MTVMRSTGNAVQIIAYADSLGGDLRGLATVMERYFPPESVGGIHILPFYPSTGDRGFSPTTQTEVDPRFGTWDDIRALADRYAVMSDLIVNHVSSRSEMFQSYLALSGKSPYRDFFITAEKFSRHIGRRYHPSDTPDGNAVSHLAFDALGPATRDFLETYPVRAVEGAVNALRRHDPILHSGGVNRITLRRLYRPRPGTPFVPFQFADGRVRNIWCTFTPDQIDLDTDNPDVRKMLAATIRHLARQGIATLRLDAVGYATKRRGTNSFLIPKTYELIGWLADTAHEAGLSVLPEIHSHYTAQLELARTRGVDRVYDFVLPLLVLEALFSGRNRNLLHWLEVRPSNTVTTLDTHDGLPVIDTEDLMTPEEKDRTVGRIIENGGNSSMRASGSGGADNVDVYQVNCTYYDALGRDDAAYLTARAIQFFVPGIPQVYYVGLLAGENDEETLARTNNGRDINRHDYSLSEIGQALTRPVVRNLLELIRFRSTHPAFDGSFSVLPSPEHILAIRWRKGRHTATLKADLRDPERTVIRRTTPETPDESLFTLFRHR